MGKLISWVAVVLLIVVVPLGSWFYLSKGLTYRKNALSELKAKDSILAKADTLVLLKGKTSLVVIAQNDTNDKILAAIEEQFKNTPGFQIIYKDSILERPFLPKGYLSGAFSKYEQKSFVLIDQKLRIRNSYANDMDAVKKMVEHIAIVIPRPKESDIEMKN